MFKIDELLDLFSDEKIRKMLVASYRLSQENDKYLSDSVFEQFLLLKKLNPNINVVLDITKEKSCFNPEKDTIYINTLSIGTFFHELTHLLSYYYLSFKMPNEYYLFKENFHANPANTSLIIQFLELCKRKRVKFLNESVNNEDANRNINENNNANYEQYSNSIDIICKLEDIVDALYDGRSFSQGLVNIDDINSYPVKSKPASGHGCEYFHTTSFQFEEILADYQAIKLTDSKNELFVLLKDILGIKFICFLEQRSNEICGKIPKIELNNSILKH